MRSYCFVIVIGILSFSYDALGEAVGNHLDDKTRSECGFLDKSSTESSSSKVKEYMELASSIITVSRNHKELSEEIRSNFKRLCGNNIVDKGSLHDSRFLYSKKIIEKLLKDYTKNNVLLEIELLNTWWYYLNATSQHQKSFKVAKRAIDLASKQGNQKELLSELYIKIITPLLRLGRYAEVLHYIRRGLALKGKIEESKISSLHFSKGFLYRDIGEYDLAIQSFNQALEAYVKSSPLDFKNKICFKGENANFVARRLLQIGAVYRELDDLEQAVKYQSCASAIYDDLFKREGFQENYQIVAKTEEVKNLILSAELAEKMASKNDFYRSAIEKANLVLLDVRIESPQKIENLLALLTAHTNLGQLEKAKLVSQSIALELGYQEFEDKDLLSIENDKFYIKQLDTFRYLIELYHRLGKKEWVEVFSKKAFQLIERKQKAAANLQAWKAARHDFFESYFKTFESVFTESNVDDVPNLYFKLEKHYSLLPVEEKRMFEIKESILDSNSVKVVPLDEWLKREKEYANAQENIGLARDKLLASQDKLLISNATKKGEHTKQIERLSLQELQQALPEADLIIRYFISDDVSFGLAITRDTYKVFQTPTKSEIKEFISQSYFDNRQPKSIDENSERLLQSLIPLELVRTKKFSRIILIPDGPLHKVPFPLINTSQEKYVYQPLVDIAQLITTHSISEFYRNIVDTNTVNSNLISVFSNPNFEVPYRSDKLGQRSSMEMLAALPGTESEATSIKKYMSNYNLNIVSGDEASQDFLLNKNTKNSKVLHIATHGYFDPSKPEIVGLITSTKDKTSEAPVGFLSLNKLMSKEINSKLVVLSGCDTMLGKNYQGSGMRSMTRGFLTQGAGSVIGTLWPVQDRATAKFMDLFYKNLVENDFNSSKALQLTQNQFSKRGPYRDPKFWAGFVMTARNQSYLNLGLE